MNQKTASREATSTMRRLRHEIRTPLGHIIGYSELLEEDALESGREETVPDLQRIRTAAQGLLALVDELLGGESATEHTGADPEEPRAAAALSRAAGGDPGGRLLVVDDDAGNRDLLRRQLERAGHRVTAVEDGPSALRVLAEEAFDGVLLDVLMPGMSGLEVLAAIRRDHGRARLPVILATALDGAGHVVEGLALGANDHVAKPFDFPVVIARVEAQLALKRANDEIEELARNLEIRNAFIRRIFGRYVSEEVVATLLEEPDALDLAGETREVTVLTADLRGFSALTAECAPTEVLAVLNHYLGGMSEVIQRHGGVIDDFFGDGILAFFGAPVARPDHAAQAVRCAVAMQLALRDVNRRNREQRLPEIEMGVGIATGDVIVGSMGSEARSKYGAIGLPVNLAGRIESCTLGGEILIDDATWAAARDVALLGGSREVHPKGFETALRIHRVVGLAEKGGAALAAAEGRMVPLATPVPVELSLLDGKQVGQQAVPGRLQALSVAEARIACDAVIPEMTDVRIVFLAGEEDGLQGAGYAKVVESAAAAGAPLTIRFTARPTALIERIRAAIGKPTR